MKQIVKERVASSLPSRKWRKKYQCKVTKSDHEFKLVIPKHSFSFLNEGKQFKTVDEYYKYEHKRKEGRSGWMSQVLYYYECIHCKKAEYAFGKTKLPNNKIRKIIK